MTNTDITIPVEHDHAVRLHVGSAHQSDDRRWDQQIELIKRTGAGFDEATRSWHLWLDDPALSTPRLAHLWRAVLEYGTTVTVTAIKPPAASATRAGEPVDLRQVMAKVQRAREAVAAKLAARRPAEPTQH